MIRSLGYVLMFVAGGAVGALGGYIYSETSNDQYRERQTERNHALLRELESIQGSLTCEEMNKDGLSAPRRRDGITYYLNVRERDYQVIGFVVDAYGPAMSWTGADRPQCR